MPPARPEFLFRCQRLLAGFGVALLLFLTLVDRGATRIYLWPWAFYFQILLALPPAWLLGRLLFVRRPIARFGGPIDALLIAGVAITLVSALASPFPHQSLLAAAVPLAGVSCAWLVRDALESGSAPAPPADLERFVRGFGGVLALILLDSLGQWLVFDLLPAGQREGFSSVLAHVFSFRNEHPLGHGNYTAGLSLLMIPWFVALAGRARGRMRWTWSAAAALALIMLFSSASRGGLAALAAVVVLAGIALARQRGASRARLASCALALVVATGVLAALHPRVRLVVRQWRDTGTLNTGDRQRLSMAQAGAAMLLDHPGLGVGPGVTPRVYPQYRARLTGGVETAEQLHSTPIQVAADLGLPGLALLLLLGVAGLRRLHLPHTRSADPDDPAAWIRVTAGATLGGYALFSLTDYQLDVPIFPAALATCLALLCATQPRRGAATAEENPAPRPPSAARRWLAAGGLAAGFALTLAVAFPWMTARREFAHAVDALSAGDYATFDRLCAAAEARAPWAVSFLNTHAWAAAERRTQAADPAARAALLDTARAFYRRSLAIDPAQELGHFNLGWLTVRDDPAAAEGHFRAAARLVPDKGGVYLGLALSLYNQRNEAGAVAALALEGLNDPRFLTSPWWRDEPFATLRPAVRERLDADYARVLAALPADGPLYREATYAQALSRWLAGDAPAASVAAVAPTAERAAFFATLPALDRRTWTPPPDPDSWPRWQLLYAAWTQPAQRDVFLRRALRLPAAAEATPLLGQLTQFLAAPAPGPVTFAQKFLAIPSPPALARTLRNQRLAYGLMMKNLDVPVPLDFYPVRENLVAADFLAFLFPMKGYLPGPVLVRQLDAISVTARL
jgi:hypothetical protein